LRKDRTTDVGKRTWQSACVPSNRGCANKRATLAWGREREEKAVSLLKNGRKGGSKLTIQTGAGAA